MKLVIVVKILQERAAWNFSLGHWLYHMVDAEKSNQILIIKLKGPLTRDFILVPVKVINNA